MKPLELVTPEMVYEAIVAEREDWGGVCPPDKLADRLNAALVQPLAERDAAILAEAGLEMRVLMLSMTEPCRQNNGESETEFNARSKQSQADAAFVRRHVERILALASADALARHDAAVRLEEQTKKDAAYRERDQLVCALSKLFPSSLERHPDTDTTWENDWRWIVFINLPTGQATWHIHDSELGLFGHLQRCTGAKWDGHTTPQKYERIAALEGRAP